MASSATTSYLRIHPTAHVADKASLHTSSHNPHPIIVGAHCVIHPFARLDSSAGPIALGERCVIWEKVQIGSSSTSSRRVSASAPPILAKEEEGAQAVKTITLADGVTVQAHAKIPGPATIDSNCNIGVAAEIGDGANLGQGVAVASSTHIEHGAVLEKNAVVFGAGRVRRAGVNADRGIQRNLDRARSLKEQGEEKHRVLMTQLVKGTAGGTRFTG